MARARRLLDEHRRDTAERGYVLLPQAVGSVLAGEAASSHDLFAEVASIGERFGDRDLIALRPPGRRPLADPAGRGAARDGAAGRGDGGRHRRRGIAGRGRRHLLQRDRRLRRDLRPAPGAGVDRRAGALDARRSRTRRRTAAPAWSTAPSCCSSTASGPTRWARLEHACECLAGPPVHRAIGAAWYRLAELHRLRGEADEAEELYRRGSRWGRDPHPGLALLRLAQGQVDAAVAAIRRVVAEAQSSAHARARDLARLRRDHAGRGRRRRRARRGRRAGRAWPRRSARRSCGRWRPRPPAPCCSPRASRRPRSPRCARRPRLAARSRRRTRRRGPGSSSASPIAPWATRTPPASSSTPRATPSPRSAPRPMSRRLDAIGRPAAAGEAAGGLTPARDRGAPTRGHGQDQPGDRRAAGISEKTVARHVSNIFTKLGLSTRAAATAYAFQHDLLPRPT